MSISIKAGVFNRLRSLVVVTSGIPGLHWLYVRYYRLALGLVIRFLGRDKDVLVLMVRSGEKPGRGPDSSSAAESTCRPGISDIDLTVIVRPHSVPERLSFLRWFWRRYSQLRMIAPMLVEVDILTLEEFAASLRIACPPMQSRKTFRIVLDRLSPPEQEVLQDALAMKDRRTDFRDHQRNLLMRYQYFTLPHLFQAGRPNDISTTLLNHSLKKMADLIQPSVDRARFDALDATGKLHALLPLLRSHLSRHPSPDGVDIKEAAFDLRILGAHGHQEDDPLAIELHSLLNETLVPGDLEGTNIVFWRSPADDGCFSVSVLIADDASEEHLCKAFSTIRRFRSAFDPLLADRLTSDPNLFGQDQGWPLLLPMSLWPIWCRTYPLEAAAIKQGGCVIKGDGPVVCPEPERDDFLQSASVQYGIWLINRNDWAKEAEPRRTELFGAMSAHIQRYRNALTDSSPIPAEHQPGESRKSFEDVYRTSGLQLDRLGDTIKASESH